MNKEIEIKFEDINFIIVAVMILATLIGSILITYDIIETMEFSYFLIFIGIISFIIYIITKIKDFKFSKFEIAIFGLTILTLLSLLGTVDYKIALWGRYTRAEGLFVILSYYMIALITSNIKNKTQKKIIVGGILTIGLCNIIYGLMQTDWITLNLFPVYNKWYYARGLNGNSMYYGSLLSICYPIVLGLFIKEDKLKKNIFYGILLTLFTFGTLLSGSMAVLLAEIIVFSYIFIQCLVLLIKTKSKEYAIQITKLIFSIIIFVIFAFIQSNKTEALSNDIKEMTNQAAQVATTAEVNDSFGTGRIYIWRNTIEKIKDHWLFGVGVDNFRNAFDRPLFDKQSGMGVYKAHNEYLQKMICEGVLSGICYTFFMIAIGVKNIKNEDKLYYGLLLGFACYSIQAFFGISVVRVSPVFFIVVGLLMAINRDKSALTEK